MRILLSAYACAPGFGSEPEVGLRALLAAAQANEVWVLFRADFEDALRSAVAESGCERAVHLVPLHVKGLPKGLTEPGLPLPGLPSQHLHYERWQRAAERRARELHQTHQFDVVHHITMSAHWTLIGVGQVEAPLVLGPLGGGVEVPARLLPVLGLRGLAEYLVRSTTRRALRHRPRVAKTLEAATVTLAQNAETARRLPHRSRVVIQPNATLIDVGDAAIPNHRTSDVVMCGRLVPWKGGALAIRTIAEVTHPGARLVVYGNGPDRSRMEKLARRLGVESRVSFASQRPRAELLGVIASSGVLLHPALHDESPLAVSEALSLGTPVVALDHGGARSLAKMWPSAAASLITPASPTVTARRLAGRIDEFLARPVPVVRTPSKPSSGFREVVQAAYEQASARP